MSWVQSVRVGTFLGVRQIRRASRWTTVLIIAVMTLTFLNLVFVSGLLVGIIEGALQDYRTKYSGEILIKKLPTKNYILETQKMLFSIKSLNEVEGVSPRYIAGGTIEANYKNKFRQSDRHDSVGVSMLGIDPEVEDKTMKLSSNLFKGEYLQKGDEEGIMIGYYLLSQYSNVDFPGEETLDNVSVGDKVKVTIGNAQKELVVRGVLKSKVDEISIRAYINDSLMRKMSGRLDYNVSEIAVHLKPGVDPYAVKKIMINQGLDQYAEIQTWDESMGTFIKEITNTFSLLGTFIGSIGLAVASITVFIVVFINAITRRKFIGIMKGIGISAEAIEISYVIQSVVYAIIGSALGALIVYGMAIPYFNKYPINFPFSDGILVAPVNETLLRILLIMVATIIAGYLPAKIVCRANTLNAILGR